MVPPEESRADIIPNNAPSYGERFDRRFDIREQTAKAGTLLARSPLSRDGAANGPYRAGGCLDAERTRERAMTVRMRPACEHVRG
jgi:hypothetical protein